jgi:hypothetical protein
MPSALAVLRLIASSLLGGCLHWQVGRLLTLEDTINVGRRLPELIDVIRTIGDQAAIGDVESSVVDGGQFVRKPGGIPGNSAAPNSLARIRGCTRFRPGARRNISDRPPPLHRRS